MNPPRAVELLRWVLLLPVSFFAFCLTFYVGMRVYSYVEEHYCTPAHFWNGMCYDSSADAAMELVYRIFAGIAPLAVGLSAVAMAPAHRLKVAWAAWLAGNALLAAMAVRSESAEPLAVAAASGTFGVLAITAWLRRRAARPD